MNHKFKIGDFDTDIAFYSSIQEKMSSIDLDTLTTELIISLNNFGIDHFLFRENYLKSNLADDLNFGNWLSFTNAAKVKLDLEIVPLGRENIDPIKARNYHGNNITRGFKYETVYKFL